ncbi:MAG: GNAT family N-acetyltransferase [Hyphomicrobiaceae bacterium]
MQLELETERLILRPLSEADLDLGFELFTDPEVMRYVGDLETPESLRTGMPVWCRRCGGGRIGVWVACKRDTNEKIGTGILLPLPIDLDDTDWSLVDGGGIPDAEIEVGYILKTSAWGKGYATEICARLIRFAFEETPLDEIVAVTDPENQASMHVLKKCGMTFRGVRRAYAGEATDFSITRAQWEAA